MAQTLKDKRIKVEAGDTLSGIYGSDWKNLSGYTGDPTKLQIGTILPTKPDTTITTDVLSGGNNTVDIGSPVVSPTPIIPNDTQTVATEDLNKFFKDYLATQTAPPSQADAHKETYGSVDTPEQIKQKEAAQKASTDKVNALNAQIQGIMDSATQAQLTLESQASGKDITTSFLGKQQQEISRQSAIKILPLQVQVLAVQSELTANTALLEQAQGKIDEYFKYQQQDAENDYNYKQGLIDKFFQYAEKAQQDKLNEKKTEDTRAFQLANANRSDQNSWASAAAGNGQGALASQIMALDATSDTFQADLARLSGQITPITKVDTGVADKAFFSAAKAIYADYQQDIKEDADNPWGTAWNRLKAQFPNKTNAEIDAALGKVIESENTALQIVVDGQLVEFPTQEALDQYRADTEVGDGTVSTTKPVVQYTRENYKPAGTGMVMTPDGKIIPKDQIQADITKNTPKPESFVTTGHATEPSGLWRWISGLFGKKDLSSMGITKIK